MNHKRRSRRKDKLPVEHSVHEDGPCTGKPKKKKARPKKEKCPVNGRHEWYHEWVEEPGEKVFPRRGYGKCADCVRPYRTEHGRYYRWYSWHDWEYCAFHKLVVPYVKRFKRSTCIHCWKVKDGRAYYNDHQSYVRHPEPYRRLKRKHRPQNLLV